MDAELEHLERLAREAKAAAATLAAACRRPDQAAIAAAHREMEATALVFLEQATPDAWLLLVQRLRSVEGGACTHRKAGDEPHDAS